ncbi:glycosyltransferase family 2 protein [Halosimplex amylolyticum]|uniref:glycosyltransferase family 2 protein n=1 Tax=Halosimplex amylolyticum TaxID=3396616 RepID=UPI003F550054
MPTVSVVIPTYDRADVLPRAMDSALGQTFADLELVVVDDGSTDETESVVADYDDDRVRYVAHETNRGGNVARNTGIEAAEGEYVAFLDSDDEWKPTKLERQIDRLEADDADWVAAYCDFETRREGPAARLESLAAGLLARADDDHPTEGGEELVGEILADRLHPGAGSTLVARTDVARSVGGFDEELDRFQDPEFVLRLLDEGPLAHVDAPLVVRHDTGTPAAETVAAADREYLAKYADAVERAEERGFDVRGRHNLILAKRHLAEGSFLTGIRHLAGATVPGRHVPGLAWAAAGGFRRRTDRRTVLTSALAVAVLVVAARRR